MKTRFLAVLTLSIALIFSTNSFSQANLNKIKKAGVIKIGMTGTQPPFSMESKEGELMGYEVDLAELLAESMNVELDIVQLPFAELIPALESGKIDVIMSGMTMTMERNAKVAFVGPYVLSGKSVLTKMETLSKADEAEDFNMSDMKVTSLKGSTSESFVNLLLPDATSMPADNYQDAVDMLFNDEATVLVADFPIIMVTILKNSTYNLFTIPEPLTMEPIGMAIAPGDPLMLNFMENYINALYMGGVLDELEYYWFEDGSWIFDMK